MTALSEFLPEHQNILVGLPYKVGMYMSHADDAHGEVDDEREVKALERCIRAIAGLHEDKPLTSEIMRACLASQEEWEVWGHHSFNAPDAARQAVEIMQAHASEQEFKNYREALMEIATTVAQAYGEFGEFDEEDEGGSGLSGLLGKITGKLAGMSAEDKDHPMNVSAAEDEAISVLRAALQA